MNLDAFIKKISGNALSNEKNIHFSFMELPICERKYIIMNL